jgi:hypothetical protein
MSRTISIALLRQDLRWVALPSPARAFLELISSRASLLADLQSTRSAIAACYSPRQGSHPFTPSLRL